MPSEIICNEAFFVSGIDLEDLKAQAWYYLYYALDAWYFDDERCRKYIAGAFSCEHRWMDWDWQDYDCGVIAAGALLKYLYETQKTSLSHITSIDTVFYW